MDEEIVIETDRLILRKYKLSDVNDVVEKEKHASIRIQCEKTIYSKFLRNIGNTHFFE